MRREPGQAAGGSSIVLQTGQFSAMDLQKSVDCWEQSHAVARQPALLLCMIDWEYRRAAVLDIITAVWYFFCALLQKLPLRHSAPSYATIPEFHHAQFQMVYILISSNVQGEFARAMPMEVCCCFWDCCSQSVKPWLGAEKLQGFAGSNVCSPVPANGQILPPAAHQLTPLARPAWPALRGPYR